MKEHLKRFIGRRICPMCNKEFVPESNSQIACSVECSRKRRNAVQKLFRVDMRPMEIDWLNALYEEALETLNSKEPDEDISKTVMSFVKESGGTGDDNSLQNEVNSLREELASLKKKAAMDMEQAANMLEELKRNHKNEIEEYKKKLKDASDKEEVKVGMKECTRMKLRAYELPCGQRAECFSPKRCASVPSDAKEITDNMGTAKWI